MSRLPYFPNNWLIDGGKDVSCPLPPGSFLVLISIRGWVDPRDIAWLEEFRSIEKTNVPIVN
jgi:hypothetical protein